MTGVITTVGASHATHIGEMARDTLFTCCIAVFQSYEIADSQTAGYQAEDDEADPL